MNTPAPTVAGGWGLRAVQFVLPENLPTQTAADMLFTSTSTSTSTSTITRTNGLLDSLQGRTTSAMAGALWAVGPWCAATRAQ